MNKAELICFQKLNMAICAVKREILLIKRALRKVKVWPTKKGQKNFGRVETQQWCTCNWGLYKFTSMLHMELSFSDRCKVIKLAQRYLSKTEFWRVSKHCCIVAMATDEVSKTCFKNYSTIVLFKCWKIFLMMRLIVL